MSEKKKILISSAIAFLYLLRTPDRTPDEQHYTGEKKKIKSHIKSESLYTLALIPIEEYFQNHTYELT